MTSTRPLFVALKAVHFDRFEDGTKRRELRPYGPRWNERTCVYGRAVTLSNGYGKARRLSGVITGFAVMTPEELTPSEVADFVAIYGASAVLVAVIAINVKKRKKKANQ